VRRFNISSGVSWEAKVGYSRLVKVGRQIYVSGTTALGADGAFIGAGDAGEQTRQALRNVEAGLAQVGSSLSDVVRTRLFVLDIERDHAAVGEAHRAMLGGVLPATSMIEVRKLIDPRMLVEIEVEAIKGSGQVVAGVRPRIVEATFEPGSDLAEMLRSVDLPLPVDQDHVAMLKGYVGGELVGCVGYARYGDSAVLHSLVVIRRAKGEGVGRALVESLLARVAAQGVRQVFLVTSDTAQYFGYLGFAPLDRGEVDPAVLAAPEISAYGPDEVIFMRYRFAAAR
jgi:enamine deaminase RidA (YjgF/YER057c/UK114 family)